MSHSQIQAAEQLMKIAINNQNHVDSLVGFYRDLIDSFNNQRAEWILHYNNINTTADDQYLLEKQLNSAQAIMSDLEKSLAEKKAQLTMERQRYFKILENNGNIKKRLQQSKTNYRELMNTCKPIGLTNKQFNNTSILNSSAPRNEQPKLPFLKQPPNPKTTELELELINTNKQHIQKKKKLKHKIDLLKNQLRDLMKEFQDRQEQNKSEYWGALEKLCDLERKYAALTVEFFRFRSTGAVQEKKLQEENQVIRLKNLAILQKLKNIQKSHSDQFKSVDNEIKTQTKKFQSKYNTQLQKKHQHLTILKQQHERLQEIYLCKMKKLEQELRTTNQKIKSNEERTRVEIGSLKSQIKILRGRLQREGLHELRRGVVDGLDESSGSLGVEELERINQEVRNLEQQINSGK